MSGHIAYRTGAVRYQVTDVDRAVDFLHPPPGVRCCPPRRTGLRLRGQRQSHRVLERARQLWRTSAARRQPADARRFNRIVLEVDDLDAAITELRRADVAFRNAVQMGPGGRQIQITDPDGNPIEIFEAAAVKQSAD